MQYVIESIFSSIYMIFAISAGILILKKATSIEQKIIGLSILILGLGDSTHLVPRIISTIIGDFDRLAVSLGIGKLITSVTMTFFYLLMYRYIMIRYKYSNSVVNKAFLALFIIRIVLCLLPANNWTSIEGSYLMGIIRNIPFVLMGLIIISLANKYMRPHNDAYKNFDIYVALSFIFYIIVVLFAGKYPILGMFMLAKTACYMLMIYAGIRTYLMKPKEDEA